MAFLIFIFSSLAYAANSPDITSLLNQGLGLNAKKIAIELLEKSQNNKEKIQNAHLVLDVCMFISDNECFSYYWDAYWKDFYEHLDSMPRESAENKNLWSAQADYITAKYVYSINLFPSEKIVKQQLNYVKDRVIGSSQFEYSGLRTVLESRAAASIGDRVTARKLLRRARSLVLSRNLNNLTEQLTLAYCLETSIYHLFDAQDVRRFLKSFIQAGEESGVNIDSFVNPYVAVRVYRVIYESGILDLKGQAAIANDLHRLYQNLQLAPKSTLIAQKESFYAYLALDSSWGNKLNISFDSAIEFEKIVDPVNFDAIGVKAYLQSITPNLGKNSIIKLDELITWCKRLQEETDGSSASNYKRAQLYYSSLKSRLQGDTQNEKKYLEEWIDSSLQYFKDGGFSVLDQAPALTGIATKVVRYTIQRLNELDPNSDALRRLVYFTIVTLNANKAGDASISYSLLKASDSDLQVQQIQDRIKLNANYSRIITEGYYKSAKHLISSRGATTYDGGVALLEMYQLLEKFKTSDQQLTSFTNTENPIINLDYRTLAPIDLNSSVILFAESDGYVLSLILRKNSSTVLLVPISKADSFSNFLSVLTSTSLDRIPVEEIKAASLSFSRKIFGESSELGSNVQILTGPTFLNVPYTLLSDPSSGKWLLERAIVVSFLSPQQREISNKNSRVQRATDYVAFANPVLRSKKEEANVISVAGMIRGAKGGLISLAELPETETESIRFSRAFEGEKELYFGKDANIEKLISLNLDNVRVLSFSTHGVLAGEVDGAKSTSIVLSPTENNNGLIPTDWLFSVTGSPNLVILSTCNSGTSAMPLDSSELTSLASVFLLKGSDAVISSYWQVNSQGTAELMHRLSHEINQSSNYSIAFSKTIRNLQADPKWGHPSIWAAFVMVGNHKKVSKLDVVNNDIKLDINASVRHFYRKKDSTVLLSFESDSEDVWKIVETQIDLSAKQPVNSIKKGHVYPSLVEVEVSEANFYGAIVAVQSNDGWTFSDITQSGDFQKICALENVASDWLIRDFFRTSTHIYILFNRSADDGVEFGLASVSNKDCISTVKAPFQFKTGVKGFANLRLFPLHGGDEVVLSMASPIKNNQRTFAGPISELGVSPICNYGISNTFFVLGPELTLKSTATFEDMNIDNIRFAGSGAGVIGLWRDPCSKRVVPRFLSNEFFKLEQASDREMTLLRPNRFGFEIDELISQNFEEVRHIWWQPEAEYLFVDGMPIFPSGFYEKVTKETVGNDAFNEWLSGLSSVYSYSLRTKKWRRIATSEQCKFPQPLDYAKDSFFLCNDLKNSKKKRAIHLKRIH